jgi:hypothetical protein
LIETAGLMPTLTDHVITLALDQLLAWREEHLPVLSVAVNLSASSVADPTLPDRIINALRSRGLPGTVLWRADQHRRLRHRIQLADLPAKLAHRHPASWPRVEHGFRASAATGRMRPPAECGLRPPVRLPADRSYAGNRKIIVRARLRMRCQVRCPRTMIT